MSAPKQGLFGWPWWSLTIFSLIYCLSPIDALPEFPLGCIGVVDDLLVGVFGIYCLVRTITGALAPQPSVPAMRPEPRTVVVETTGHAQARTRTPYNPRLIPTGVQSDRRTGVFIVQVTDDEGGEQRIEVKAADAAEARAKVTALGADGRIGKVWLKRLAESGSVDAEVN